MTHKDAQDGLVLYAMGGMDMEEAQDMERHLERCPQCQREIDQYLTTIRDVDLSLTEPDWSGHEEMRNNFQERLGLSSKPQPLTVESSSPDDVGSKQRDMWWAWPLAWVATLMVALGGWGLAYRNQQQLSESQRIMAFVASGRRVRLSPLHAQPAKVDLYLTSSHAVVWVRKLPSLSSGRVYEGWWITNGTPRAAGTFGPGASLLVHPKAATEFAITIEPKGGTHLPTTPILVIGKV